MSIKIELPISLCLCVHFPSVYELSALRFRLNKDIGQDIDVFPCMEMFFLCVELHFHQQEVFCRLTEMKREDAWAEKECLPMAPSCFHA